MTVYRVLLATDGSDHAFRAAEYVHSMLDQLGVRVTLLYVTAPPEAIMPLPVGAAAPVMTPHYYEQGDKLAKRVLDQTRHILCMEEKRVDQMIREGNPSEEIVRAARDGKFDLVVLGCRGLKGWKGLIMGSVSTKVVADAPCAVLVVK